MKSTERPQNNKNNENQAQDPAKSPAAVPPMSVVPAAAAKVRLVKVDVVDVVAIEKRLDIEDLVTVGNCGCDLLGLQHDILALAGFISLDLIIALDGLAGFAVHKFSTNAIAGGAIERVKCNALGRRRSREQRGQVTSPNFRNPFHCARGAIGEFLITKAIQRDVVTFVPRRPIQFASLFAPARSGWVDIFKEAA
jgi:hypothetical protein